METRRREGAKFVTELPGPGPWRLAAWHGGVIAMSPHHPPLFIKDGKVTVLEAAPPLK